MSTEPMFSEALPPVPPVELAEPVEPPRRKRGRPSNAERAARGDAVPPPAPKKTAPRRTSSSAKRRTAEEYGKAVDDVLALVQAVVGMRDEVAAEIIGEGRPNVARAAGKLAANNDVVGAWLDRIGTSSDALDLAVAAGAIAVPLLAHYGVLSGTPLRHAAEPYAERVAARRAAAEHVEHVDQAAAAAA